MEGIELFAEGGSAQTTDLSVWDLLPIW